jgi:SAM-dependent methyltransferase
MTIARNHGQHCVSGQLTWFSDRTGVEAYEAGLDRSLAVEAAIQARGQWPGWCTSCRRETTFLVRSGAEFAGRPNLREGLRCIHCKLSARQRSVLMAMQETIPDRRMRGSILEQVSILYRRIRREFPQTKGSEFLTQSHAPGRHYVWRSPARPWLPRILRHESILDLSYRSDSLDFLVHTDVLEHVHDTAAALEECRRVLSPGGVLVFTAPFFTRLDRSTERGYLDPQGRLVEILPSEYHGDGLNAAGIYTFHNFGWSMLELLCEVFPHVEIGMIHSPISGFVHADGAPGDWNMAPIVFRAYKHR